MRLGLIFILSLVCLPINSVHAESEALTKWFEGYQHEFLDTENEESAVCPVVPSPVDPSIATIAFGMRSCRPPRQSKSFLYSDDMTEQEKRRRDDLICRCFKEGNTFESSESFAPSPKKDSGGQEWRKHLDRLSAVQYASKVFGEGFGPAITSMNFAENQEQAEKLAGVYIQWNRDIERKDVDTLKSILDPSSLTDEMCVPPREFIFHEQFPVEASFYEDLKEPFNPDNWDYAKLARKFDGISKLEDSYKVPDAERIMARMKFLLHNPQYKAMFMSPDADAAGAKAKLYQMLQTNLPKPDCADKQCDRSESWKNQLHDYQDAAREFLSNPTVMLNIQSGIREGQKMGWSKKKISTSELIDDPTRASEKEWKTYCDFRKTEPSSVRQIIAEIEDDKGINFENISSEDDFKKINKAYCTIPRRDGNDRTMLFGDYRKQNCSSVNRRTCLAKFVQAYPYSSDNMIGLRYNINEILEKPDTIAQVSASSTNAITAIGSDSKARSQSIQYLDEQPSHIASHSVMANSESVAKVNTPAANTATQQAQLNQQLLNSQPVYIQEPLFQPQVQVPTPAAAAPQKVETIRENLSQNESQAQLLRNEISALRAQLTERTERKGSPGAEPSSVEQRLSSLEKRLSDKERENSDLRQQLSSAQRPQTVSTAEVAPSRETTDRQNFSGNTASASSAVGPQAVAAPAPISAPLAPAGGGFSSSSLTSPSKAISASGSDFLSSKYGPQEAGPQGAITVSSSGSVTNRSVLPLTVSSEEFNRLASNDDSALAKYLSQVKAVPGEVVRLAIKTSDERSMEVFVVNNGTEFEIFRTPEAASALAAERKPASVNERSNTLQDLKNEFTN